MLGQLESGCEIVVTDRQIEVRLARPRIGSLLRRFALFAPTPAEIELIALHELLAMTQAPAP
jgi:hypothetical protein